MKHPSVHVMFLLANGWRGPPLARLATVAFILVGAVPDWAKAESRGHFFSEQICPAEACVPYNVETYIKKAREDNDNLSAGNDIIVGSHCAIVRRRGIVERRILPSCWKSDMGFGNPTILYGPRTTRRGSRNIDRAIPSFS